MTFEGLKRTVESFADDFLDTPVVDTHCETCARRLKFGECPFCDGADDA